MSKVICRALAFALVSIVSWAVVVLALPAYTIYQVTENTDNDARVDVALGADGTPHAVYVRYDVLYYRVGLGAERSLGWVGSSAHPAIAVGADRVHIVHTDGAGGVYYKCRGFDGSVMGDDRIGTRSWWADVAVDSAGGVHIVYLDDASLDGYADVRYVNNLGGGFINPTTIFDAQDINPWGACHFRWWYDRPAIQVDDNDHIHIIAWEHESEAGCGYGVYHYYRVAYMSNRDGGRTARTADLGNTLALGRNPLWVDANGVPMIACEVVSSIWYVIWDGTATLAWTILEGGTQPAISGQGSEALIAFVNPSGQVCHKTVSPGNSLPSIPFDTGAAPAVAVGSLFVYFEKTDGSDNEIYVYTDQTMTQRWKISASADPSAGGSVSGSDTYDDGSSVTLEATANACYQFVNWTEGGTEVSTNSSYNFTASSDRTLVANFAAAQVKISKSVEPSDGGSAIGDGYYDCGASVEMIATPNVGYVFEKWTEDDIDVSTDAKYSFTAAADRNLLAHFQAKQFTLTVDVAPAGGGDVTVEVVQTPSAVTASRAWSSSYPYQVQYGAGTTVRLTALAGMGYEYDEFTGDTGATDPSGTSKGGPSGSIEVIMDRDRSITGNFTAIPKYTLTLDVAPAGGGEVAATALPKGIALPFPGHARVGYPIVMDYYEGTRVQIDATAGQGFEFDKFTGDLDQAGSSGVAAPKGGSTGQTEVVMDQDRHITANFSAVVGLFFEDFDDIAGWTSTGLWHVADDPSCIACGTLDGSFAHYARAGRCDYSTGARTAGTLTSPVILLKGAKSVELSFDYFRHVASFAQNLFADATLVEARFGRGMWRTVWQKSTWNRSPDCGTYVTRISAGVATTMQIRFVFDSRNRFQNGFPGWAVDNLKVRDAATAKPLSVTSEAMPSGAAREGLYALTYPNPVRDVHTTTFAVQGADVEEIRVRIYNLAGQLIYEEESPGGELDWHTDTSSGEYAANGIYIYAVEALIDNEWIHFPLQTVAVLK